MGIASLTLSSSHAAALFVLTNIMILQRYKSFLLPALLMADYIYSLALYVRLISVIRLLESGYNDARM